MALSIKIERDLVLEGVPSASGVEFINNTIYVVGDDSATVFRFSSDLRRSSKIALYDSKYEPHQRIPKKRKPDFEALCTVCLPNGPYLLILGSGSKKNGRRDRGFLLPISAKVKNIKPLEVSLAPLYKQLRKIMESKGGKLNIEAATTTKDNMLLFQRRNGGCPNYCITYNLKEFLSWLMAATPLPKFKLRRCALPKLNGIEAGFSGAATISDDKMLISASVEDTDDPVNDGIVYGSFIGVLKLDTGKLKFLQIMDGDVPYLGKIESVTIVSKTRNIVNLFAVTDDDKGGSRVLRLRLKTDASLFKD